MGTKHIKSTNANGVTVGSAADTVKVNLDIPDEIVKDGQLTDTYKNNGVTGIPQDYETVVVYKKAVQDQSVTIIYQDKSDNNKVLATDTVKGKPGTELGYTTTDKITDFENKGYKLVSDGVPKNGTFGNEPETYYVTLEHATTVTPDPKNSGKDTPVIYVKNEADKYNLVENFVDEAGNKLADSVTKGTDYKEGNDYGVAGDAKVIEGYYLKEVPANAKGTFGKDNVTVDFVYAKVGKIVPVDSSGKEIPGAPTPDYNNDPKDPTKGTPQVPSVTPNKPGEDTPVIYTKVETPQTPVEASTTPTQPEVVTPAPAKEAPQTAAELSQMGDENETIMAAVGAAIVVATLDLTGFGVKKKDEKISKFLSE